MITNRSLEMLTLEAEHPESKSNSHIFPKYHFKGSLMTLGVSLVISGCVDLAILNTKKLIQLYGINPS